MSMDCHYQSIIIVAVMSMYVVCSTFLIYTIMIRYGSNSFRDSTKRDWYDSSVDDKHPYRWIFIHYHKTGHDLSRKLASMFEGPTCNATVSHRFKRRVNVTKNADRILQADISVMAAPDMPVEWNGKFLNSRSASRTRFVHFVRDPFEMIISGYLYHAQTPMPSSEEGWLANPAFHPCETNEDIIFGIYATKLAEYDPLMSKSEIIRDIKAIIANCNHLVQHVKNWYSSAADGEDVTYHHMLNKLGLEDGLALEAARSLIQHGQGPGGDVLRMAVNALYERETEIMGRTGFVVPEEEEARRGGGAPALFPSTSTVATTSLQGAPTAPTSPNAVAVASMDEQAQETKYFRTYPLAASTLGPTATVDSEDDSNSKKVSSLYRTSKRVFMSDFALGDAHTFRRSTRNLLSFLMDAGRSNSSMNGEDRGVQFEYATTGSGSHDWATRSSSDTREHLPFWSCMNISAAVNRAFELAFVASHPHAATTNSSNAATAMRSVPNHSARSTHVTRGIISAEEREAVTLYLREHPDFGRLLFLVQSILRNTLHVESSD